MRQVKETVKTAQYKDEDFNREGIQNQSIDHDDDLQDKNNTAGVKVISFDEDIKRVFCAKSTNTYGHFAIVGATKLTVYLAYAEDVFAGYDELMTLTKYDLIKYRIGPQVSLVEFLPSGDFYTYSHNGDLAQWSLKQKLLI